MASIPLPEDKENIPPQASSQALSIVPTGRGISRRVLDVRHDENIPTNVSQGQPLRYIIWEGNSISVSEETYRFVEECRILSKEIKTLKNNIIRMQKWVYPPLPLPFRRRILVEKARKQLVIRAHQAPGRPGSGLYISWKTFHKNSSKTPQAYMKVLGAPEKILPLTIDDVDFLYDPGRRASLGCKYAGRNRTAAESDLWEVIESEENTENRAQWARIFQFIFP